MNPTRQQFNLDTPLLSIDVETTGLDPENDQVLEIGAVIDFDGTGLIDQLPTFRCLVRHPQYKGQPYAIQLNVEIFRVLAGLKEECVNIFPPEVAIQELYKFIALNTPAGVKKVTPAGKNFAGFDRPFVRGVCPVLFDQLIAPRLAYRTFDAGNLYWQPEDGFNLPGLEECLHRADMQATGLHTAVGDAIDVIRLIRYKMALARDAVTV